MTADPTPEPPRGAPRGDQHIRRLAEQHGLSGEAAQAVADIDQTMGRIRRSMMRREFGRRILQQLDADLEIGHMDVIGAIAHEECTADAEPAPEMTVGLVAERLTIDPSRASRLVAEVVERGYVRRVASQADARRIGLELTDRGRAFIHDIRELKWRLFSQSLGRWSENDLIVFSRLLERFSTWTEPQPSQPDPDPPAAVTSPAIG